MGHNRKPHTRKYPLRADGTRKPGRVSVNGAYVSESSGGDGGGGCCLLIIIIAGVILFKAYHWIANML